MAKEKKAKGALPQRNIHLRLAYLHQAAIYLESQRHRGSDIEETSKDVEDGSPQLRHLVSHLKGVSRKSVVRLQRDIKRSLCKGCDEILISGKTSVEMMENRSKNAAKLGAGVLVVKCRTCGTVKRFPVGVESQQRKTKDAESTKVIQAASEV